MKKCAPFSKLWICLIQPRKYSCCLREQDRVTALFSSQEVELIPAIQQVTTTPNPHLRLHPRHPNNSSHRINNIYRNNQIDSSKQINSGSISLLQGRT